MTCYNNTETDNENPDVRKFLDSHRFFYNSRVIDTSDTAIDFPPASAMNIIIMQQLRKAEEGCRISVCNLLLFCFSALTVLVCASEKLRYVSDTFCDRHSLDALYHEKYQLITNNVFADTKEFASRVADLVADSLTTAMSQLPDRDVSDNHEKKIHSQFKGVKDVFNSKVKKIQKNITTAWESLVASNFDLLFDNEKSSLEDYMNKTISLADSYSEGRKTLDTIMSAFVDIIKSTVRDGVTGIRRASEIAIKSEEEKRKKNETEGGSTEDASQKNKNKDEILRDKMIEIAKMIVPGFLGRITIEAIERNVDLSKKSGIAPENRDSVLDDIIFDMIMMKNRILAYIRTDVPRDKGSTDLARRSIYTYWADLADEMYQEKLRAATKSKDKSKDKSKTGRLFYRNLWQDEEQLGETLLNLMEIYP